MDSGTESRFSITSFDVIDVGCSYSSKLVVGLYIEKATASSASCKTLNRALIRLRIVSDPFLEASTSN